MRLDRQDLKYLWDMLDAAETVVELTRGRTLVEYEATKALRLAVERAIEIIGEAARHVSQPTRDQMPAITWSAIVGTRHIIAHEYADLQHDKIWRMAMIHVPELIKQLKPVVDANPPTPPQP